MRNKIVVIGSLFDDCHCLGINIIEKSLAEIGCKVINLGINTPLETFLQCVKFTDIVLVSSINGHAFDYLSQEEIIYRFEQFRRESPDFPIIIGGNLHPYQSPEYVKKYLEKKLGLTRVFAKPIPIAEVVSLTKKYLAKSTTGSYSFLERVRALEKILKIESRDSEYKELTQIANNRIHKNRVSSMAKEFRLIWSTAEEVPSLEEIINRQLSIPRPMHEDIRRADYYNITLIQPRCGVGTQKEQVFLFKQLVKAGADILSFQIDSNTRNGRFYENEKLLYDRALINGYPLINHGVHKTRKIAEQVSPWVPLQVRHGSKPRISVLLAYQSLSAGVTGFEGGAGTYLFPYFKSIPLTNSIHYWQLIDRLVGLLAEKGCIIDREFFGALTATLIPPEIAISFNIIESLLAAKQGVKSISVGYAEQGNRVQDIAAIMALRKLTRRYLDDSGYKNVAISTVFNSYMAGFPSDRNKAEEIIRESAITARLSRATRIMIKTAVEAHHIPTVVDNIQAIQLTKCGFLHADSYQGKSSDIGGVKSEQKLIEQTVISIMESVLESGSGDISRGFVNAIRNQYLDLPFSPNFQVKNKIIALRDCEGAVRIFEAGNIQIPQEIRRMHEFLIKERMRKERINDPSLLIYRDVTRICRGEYLRWPLDGHYVR